MINAGLSLLRALTILADQTSSVTLQKVIGDLRNDVENGQSFSEALGRHPKVFSPMYQGLVQAGESGGSLDAVMERLATTIEMQAELRGKIKSAMSYPIAVAGLVIVIVTAMLIFVVPMFEVMYRDPRGTLPLPTRWLLKMSGFVTSSWYILIAGIGGGVFGFRKWLATPKGRARFDAYKIRMPVFGTLIHKHRLARFTRTFSSLMKSGVPVLETLDIVAGTAGNHVVSTALLDAKDRVRMGEGIAAALDAHKVIPSMVTQMYAVGGRDGRPGRDARTYADYYEREVEAHRRLAHLADRAAIDGDDGCVRRWHGDRPLYADVPDHQPGEVRIDHGSRPGPQDLRPGADRTGMDADLNHLLTQTHPVAVVEPVSAGRSPRSRGEGRVPPGW